MEAKPQASSELIRDAVAGRLDAGDVVDRLSDDEVIAWSNDGIAALRLRLTCELGRLQAMAVSHQFAATAVHRLLALVADEQASAETVRRACVDVLKLLEVDGPRADAPPTVRVNRVELMQQIVALNASDAKEVR